MMASTLLEDLIATLDIDHMTVPNTTHIGLSKDEWVTRGYVRSYVHIQYMKVLIPFDVVKLIMINAILYVSLASSILTSIEKQYQCWINNANREISI